MKLSQDLKPVSYFKNNMAEVIRKLNESRGTMIITQNGEAKAALIDIKAYEDLQETLTMLEMIAQGNKNLTEGRYRSAEGWALELWLILTSPILTPTVI